MNRSFVAFARRFYRAYRNGPVTFGHGLLKRTLGLPLRSRQRIRLRSGLRMDLDLSKDNQETIFWQDGDVEVQLYWAIRELLPMGGVFVDCGANCGLMGLQARQYRCASVIFFEPHPRLARSIETNIHLNHFESTCELVPAAVSDRGGEVSFYENVRLDGSHSLHRGSGSGMVDLGKVRCVTLEGVFREKGLTGVDFLKIDTEGNDLAVLKGLGPLLRPSFVRAIYVEMSHDRDAIAKMLAAQSYAGFGKIGRSRRQTAGLRKRFERGERVCFYKPLQEGDYSQGEVLWCGKGSAMERCLNELASLYLETKEPLA